MQPLLKAAIGTGLGLALESQAAMAEKNREIKAAVKRRGIAFTLTRAAEARLKNAGASRALLRAIRKKSPKPDGVLGEFSKVRKAIERELFSESKNLIQKTIDKVLKSFETYINSFD